MSQPTRWEKDRAFEKRCREEGIRVRSKQLRDNPLPPDVQTMTFGKFKGEAVSNVNTDYLKWLIKNLEFVPDYVATELFKRNELKGVAKDKRKQLRNLAKSRINAEKKKTKCKASGSVTVGEDYEAIREQWELAGGDATQCPFGDEYTGPHLCWEDGEPVIICTSTEVCHEVEN